MPIVALFLMRRNNLMTSEELSKQIRIDAWKMAYKAKASHMGGNFSEADIIAVLYHDVLNVDPQKPEMVDRDRFVLSKGHCCAVLYACLAECGFFSKKLLDTFGKNGSILSTHISYKVPGVEFSSGSLGHGAVVAAGMALNAKLTNRLYKVYTIVGDGECDEGSIWEMIMFAGQHNLDNFTVIVDANKIQAMGNTKDIINLQPLDQKFRDFGWYATSIDGHDHNALREAFSEESEGKPKAIIANTIKGHGVAFMENSLWWHYQIPFDHYYQEAIDELNGVKTYEHYDTENYNPENKKEEVGK